MGKITELPTVTSVTGVDYIDGEDYFVVVVNPSSTPVTVYVPADDVFGNVQSNTVHNGNTHIINSANVTINSGNTHVSNLHITENSTPSTSSDTVGEGKIWADADYIYVATANNNIKRAALSSF